MKVGLTIFVVILLTCSTVYGYEVSDYNWVSYNGHQYALTLDYSNWTQAEAWAVEVGGHLAAINDEDENIFLATFITGHPTQAGDPIAWIGLEFIGGENDSRYSKEFWRWTTGEDVTFWNPHPSLITDKGTHGNLQSNDSYMPRTWGCSPLHDTNPNQQPYGIIEVPEPAIDALVDINPDSLNKNSKGQWVTVYITLPAGYDVGQIDASTIAITTLTGASCQPDYHQAVDLSFAPQIGDRDEDGIPDLTVKFDRQVLIANLCLDDVAVTVEGELSTGEHFRGTDHIRVIDRGK